MHPSAMMNGKLFFDTYVNPQKAIKIVEIGSQSINGSLREISPLNAEYIGLDFERGNGVDIVLDSPYSLPFEEDGIDFVVCSSCFEHSEMFWLVFSEALRILKPNGLFYLNVPSNGPFHQYPVDCWRFYPDAANALVTWAKKCGYNPAVLESYISLQSPKGDPEGVWNDFVAIFIKDSSFIKEYPDRIQHHHSFENGYLYGESEILKMERFPEDMRRLEQGALLSFRLEEANAEIVKLKDELIRCRSYLDDALLQINNLRSSSSWRITAPLRALKDLFKN